MLRLLSDENFRGEIVRGLLRRQPDLPLVRVQDAGLGSANDSTILEWAAQEGRILLTHDVKTMPRFAYDRVVASQSMPGVVVVNDRMPTGVVIDEILLLALCSEEGQWEGQILYLPL